MSKHTPGQLHQYWHDGREVRYARRIMACVTACAGIPTEALEAGALGEAKGLLHFLGTDVAGLMPDVRSRVSAVLAKLEGK